MSNGYAQKEQDVGLKGAVPVRTRQEQKYVDGFIKFARKNGVIEDYDYETLNRLGRNMYASHFSEKSFDEIVEMLNGDGQSRYVRHVDLVLSDLLEQGDKYLKQFQIERAKRIGDVKLGKNWASTDILAIQYALYIKTPGEMTMDGIVGRETTKKLDSYLFKTAVVDKATYHALGKERVDQQYLKDNELKITREKSTLLHVDEEGSIFIEFQLSAEEMIRIQQAVNAYKQGNPAALEEIIFRYAYSSHGAVAPKQVEEAMIYLLCYGQNEGAFQLKKGIADDSPVYMMTELAELVKTKKGRAEIIESFQGFENDRLKEVIASEDTVEIERMKKILTLLAETWLPGAKGGTGANYFGVKKQYIRGSLTEMLEEWAAIGEIEYTKERNKNEKAFITKYFGSDSKPVSVDGILGPQTILSMLFLTAKPPIIEEIPELPKEKIPPREKYAANIVSISTNEFAFSNREESEPLDAELAFYEEGNGEVKLEEFLKKKRIEPGQAQLTYYGIMVVSDLLPNKSDDYGFFIVNQRKLRNGELEREQRGGAAYSAYYDSVKKALYAVDKDGKVIQDKEPILANVTIQKEEGDYRVIFDGYPWELPNETIAQLFTVETKPVSSDPKENKARFIFPNYGAENRKGKPIGFLEVWGNVQEKETVEDIPVDIE